VVFDMDGTLLQDRLIFVLADSFGFRRKLETIIEGSSPEYEKTRRIAWLLKGISRKQFYHILALIPFSVGTEAVVRELKRRGYILAIISDSYTLATEWLKRRLGFNYTIANELSLENDKLSGEIKMPLGWGKGEEQCLKHSVCKLTSLVHLSQKTGIPLDRCVAVGDNLSDVCMVEKAGLGIAFNPKHPKLEKAADIIITEELSRILSII
ncbi:HAD-IB family phosphatase, partial [Dehalococcoidales bacterium]|nr:HAD-IB family phosphatase [Dehalococcoidales bacterium]